MLTQYEPYDISSIKKSKYLTEKELDQEAVAICEILKDISMYFSIIYKYRGRMELEIESIDISIIVYSEWGCYITQ